MDKITEKLKVTTLIDYSSRNSGKFYGYKYYIQFETLNGRSIHEYLTNSKKLFEQLEERKTYLVEYYPTPDRCIAPNTASIMLDMKQLKVLKEI
jgi:hypothetical protein